MVKHADVAVIGAGIVGLSAAFAVVERGGSVRVYESGVPGNGQSGGDSRIFRHAHDDPRLVEIARRSREVWREWQQRLGVELVSDDGAVAIGPGAEQRLQAIEAAGDVEARMIGADELAARLPILAAYDGPALLDPGGGSIRTRTAIDALAGELGKALVADEVISIRTLEDSSIELLAGGERGRFASAIVCAGHDTLRLARQAGLEIPLALAAHTRLSFAVRGEPPPALACLQDGDGRFGETGTYAAASPGNGVYNLGLSQTTPARDDGTLVEPAELGELAERAHAYVRRALPGLAPEPVEIRNCWVTELPWSSDAMAVWEAGEVLIPAGHNLFKQAPGLGRALAARALGEPLADELRPAARLGAPPGRGSD